MLHAFVSLLYPTVARLSRGRQARRGECELVSSLRRRVIYDLYIILYSAFEANLIEKGQSELKIILVGGTRILCDNSTSIINVMEMTMMVQPKTKPSPLCPRA